MSCYDDLDRLQIFALTKQSLLLKLGNSSIRIGIKYSVLNEMEWYE
jgi:hypothetical protein